MAFVSGFFGSTVPSHTAKCTTAVRMSMYDMNGDNTTGSLGQRKVKSSAPPNDSRCFKVTYVLPSLSRAETFRELQNIYQTKLVPFSSWYAEQQRIQKMGGTIMKVELAIGTAERNIGNI
eukprot:Plantae.Rhodophyta-Purpureofilum_apyrenoidigerum.ctg14589.p2 GENE.Plantae.Rhodophyta-Purpureofilum_apyrenoidigerum.ctg14589~~Plantae.Rhodophyta-Purpureofilum_apyrenoidigerum.ctg14589.p2  ORF type:complete len:120 (+),score=24.54 Plantae.Rhodophyta-Purpureofilum_apyrenoidigerum.ctg14589:149-508(+)